MVSDVRDVITCAKFQIKIFLGYDFTGGRILHFRINFCMGLATVQRSCAACDCSETETVPVANVLETDYRILWKWTGISLN